MKTEQRSDNELRYARKLSANAHGRRNTPKQGKAYARLSASELRTLVAAAQRFEQPAIDKLCAAFEPLVYKEAHNSKIIAFLKEDALNSAWEIFLDYIHKFDKRNYKKLPSLLQLNIRYELLHKIYRSKSVETTPILDDAEEAEKTPALSDQNGCISALENKVLLNGLLDKLSPGQKKVIEDTILRGLSLEEFSRANGISYTAAYRLRERGLALLRAKLQ